MRNSEGEGCKYYISPGHPPTLKSQFHKINSVYETSLHSNLHLTALTGHDLGNFVFQNAIDQGCVCSWLLLTVWGHWEVYISLEGFISASESKSEVKSELNLELNIGHPSTCILSVSSGALQAVLPPMFLPTSAPSPLSDLLLLLSHKVVSDSCNPMGCSPPGSSAHGISQARTLHWVPISSSRGSSRPRDQTHISGVSCIEGGFFTTELPGKPSLTLSLCSIQFSPDFPGGSDGKASPLSTLLKFSLTSYTQPLAVSLHCLFQTNNWNLTSQLEKPIKVFFKTKAVPFFWAELWC